jgi:hypothetical protein
MRRPEVKERFAASIRRERAVRYLLETVGGVDFAALEAQAAAETADPVDEAVSEAEMIEQMEEIDEMLPVVATAVENLSEATGMSTEEAAETLVTMAAAQAEVEAVTGADEKPAAADGEPRQAPGDKTP